MKPAIPSEHRSSARRTLTFIILASLAGLACDVAAPVDESAPARASFREVDDAPAGSCLTPEGDACGEQSPSGACFCDDGCAEFGDCCEDKPLVCDCDCAAPSAECVDLCPPIEEPVSLCDDLAGGALSYQWGAHIGLHAPGAIVAGDFDGDGAADLVVVDRVNEENHLVTYRGDGAGAFALTADRVEASSPFEVVAADVNADGHLDLALVGGSGTGTTTRVAILAGNGDGSFAAPTVYTALASSRDLVLADVDGDGDLDLVVAAPKHLSVRKNVGGSFGGATNYPLNFAGVHRVDASDLDADGDLDLLASHDLTAGGVTILRNPGGAAFGPQEFLPVGSGTDDVLARDLTGDGLPEIAALRWVTNKLISIRLNLLFLWSDPISLPAKGAQPRRLEGEDFNCDGRLDLVTVSSTGAEGSGFGVHPNLGDGSFKAQTYVDVWSMADLAIADFDSDGIPDVAAVRNAAASIVDPKVHAIDVVHFRLTL